MHLSRNVEITGTARKVTGEMAQVEARRRGNNYVGPEHILAAVFSVPDDLSAALFGDELKAIEDHLNELMVWQEPYADKSQTELPYTPRAEAVLEAARREAEALGHPELGLGHVILGLMADAMSIPGHVFAHVLKRHGLDIDAVRTALLHASRETDDQ